MRSGSAAIARNGKIDVMPITWKSAWASESEKMAASFTLPYGRARKRTRRIRSATLRINGGKAVPSYAFKKNGTLHLATAGRRIIRGKHSGVKGCRTTDLQPKRAAACSPASALRDFYKDAAPSANCPTVGS